MRHFSYFFSFFFFNDPATTEIYTLSLHDALPIFVGVMRNFIPERLLASTGAMARVNIDDGDIFTLRSEEHTSELQSHVNLVCRLLLEKKKKKNHETSHHTKTTHTRCATSHTTVRT